MYFNDPNCSGELAQMVERSLSMWEVRGSIPRFSRYFFSKWSSLLSKLKFNCLHNLQQASYLHVDRCCLRVRHLVLTKAKSHDNEVQACRWLLLNASNFHIFNENVQTNTFYSNNQWNWGLSIKLMNTKKEKFEPNVGLEPTTPRLRVSCSTDWANQATHVPN